MEKIPPVKGTRDFYPPEMAVRNWIIDGWRRVSRRNGFVEYDGPIFEYLQLYTQKSGDEIAGQLFSLQDRGGRDLAIRPEITPTLARMVNQQVNALPRPIKWFSAPRLCRAENPQKGRLREFFQWNIDIIGSDDMLADAESIYTAVDYLRSVGLTADDIEARISSRAMLAELLKDQGFAEDQLDKVYVLLDKRPKLNAQDFEKLVSEQLPDPVQRERMMTIQGLKSLDEIEPLASSERAKKALDDLRQVFNYLDLMGVGAYCRFDISIVRGLAYYTGPVFEIFDKSATLRAICGGGRYDNLLAGLGGQEMPATGFGMGDVVLEILLQEKGLLGRIEDRLDFFVIDAAAGLFEEAVRLVSELRAMGYSTGMSYKRQNMKKQMKQASGQNARFVVILGQETLDEQKVTVKDMEKGEQQSILLADFLKSPVS